MGGATTAIYLDDEAAPHIRPTDDVDCITEVTSLMDYAHLENQLRVLGFRNAAVSGDPICRWLFNGIKVDIMPTNPAILGFSNRWYQDGMSASQLYELPSGTEIKILPATFFIATKIEAFRGRGHHDYQASKDIEDIVTILDGRSTWPSEFENESNLALRKYLSMGFRDFLANTEFLQSLIGHLPPDPASTARAKTLLELMTEFSR